MNILTAIFAGQTGFLKATSSFAQRAHRVAHSFSKAEASEDVVQDLIGMKIDKASAKANSHTVKIASDLLGEIVRKNMRD